MKTKTPLMSICLLVSTSIVFSQTNTNLGTNAGNAGSSNTSIGYYAGDVVTGSANTFLGESAGRSTTSGANNLFVGSGAGYSTTASHNVFLGSGSGASSTTGNYNVLVGSNTGVDLAAGENNVMMGYQSGKFATGSNNVFLGYYTGYDNAGSSNIFIGKAAGYAENGSNKLYIENSDSSSPLIYGDFSTDKLIFNGSVGIGLTPSESLHLNGSIRGHISGALRISSGTGYVDVGAQNASWSHFLTDRPRYFFNRGLTVDEGLIGSYDEDLNLQTAGTTRLTVTNSNGDVGIGTTAPSNIQGWSKVFDVRGGSHSKILATTTSATHRTGIYSHDSWQGGGGFVGTESNHNLYLITNYDPKISVLTNGNIGIGVVAPTKKLDVDGIIGINGVSVINTNNSASDIYINSRIIRNESTVNQDGMYIGYSNTGGSLAHVRFYANGVTERMRIDASNGNVGIGITAPSELLDVNGTARLRGVPQNNSLTQELAIDSNGKIFWKNSGTASQSVIPSVDQSFDLGSPSYFFKDVYIGGKLFIGGAVSIQMHAANLNTFVGRNAGQFSSGTSNTFLGQEAGKNSTGSGNTFLGLQSGIANLAGSSNVFIGHQSGLNSSSGGNNVFVGKISGSDNTSGSDNVFIGFQSGDNNSTGAGNIALGSYTGPALSNLSNTIAIGYGAIAYANNTTVLGNNSNLVGIRQSFPAYALHVSNAYCDGSIWYNASDKNLKKNFRSIQNESTLDRLMKLKIERWNYKADSTNADHIGPTAQEFNEVFNLGSNKAAISTVDEIGIALAAIQELNKKTENLEKLLLGQAL